MGGYTTVKGTSEGSLEEKKSKFIASLCHVTTEEEAVDFINLIKSQNRKAKHNVYAYILREGNTSRYSDDGEPQGTGGVPVLEVLKKEGLTDVCVVVTRYFGGILLGTGGLARAYSSACKLATDSAVIMKMLPCSRLTIKCDYSTYGRLGRIFGEFETKMLSEDFSDSVTITILVINEQSAALKEKLTNAANGRINIDEQTDLTENFA